MKDIVKISNKIENFTFKEMAVAGAGHILAAFASKIVDFNEAISRKEIFRSRICRDRTDRISRFLFSSSVYIFLRGRTLRALPF